MANIENLKSNSERTPRKIKEMTQNGGKRSGEVRREKKAFRKAFEQLLTHNVTVDDKVMSGYNAICAQMIKEALNGNVKAFCAIRDTVGEKPKEMVEVEGGGDVEAIKVKFVKKNNPQKRLNVDPKIVGEYTPPTNIEESE